MWPYSSRDCYHNDDGIDKHWLKDIQQIINNIAIVIIVTVTAIGGSLRATFETIDTAISGAGAAS